MCGIYGSTIYYTEEQVKSKLKRTNYRGPDKTNWKYFQTFNNTLIFGHNRLSILDLDSRADQPFNYMDLIEIVYNGEIYNFDVIKQKLIKKGYKFRTTCDTEVICASYLEYGKDCVKHFNGMFAFVIYDKRKQQLFGARDRLGKKPFYYYHDKNLFEFSSQISTLQLFNEKLSISSRAIDYYFSFGVVPDPYSIFNEIKKLQAGHYFVFDMTSYEFSDYEYWDIDYTSQNKYQGSYKDAKFELDQLLTDAVSCRLYADVPVGIFLSGGVDSSLIAALATKVSDNKIKTFTVKFSEKEYDESYYAEKVAKNLNTDHHTIECTYNDGLNLIENFNFYNDDPFADSSSIPNMLLAKYTKSQVTVALSGDGGDESFLGYKRYRKIKYANIIYTFPDFIRKVMSLAIGTIPYYRAKDFSKKLNYLNIEQLYLSALTNIDDSWIKGTNFCNRLEEQKYLVNGDKNLLERISDYDIKAYLNWDINTKVDRATMAYSLEARAPLMDYHVVEFARSLPTNYKYNFVTQKRVLKDVLYQYVPSELFARKKAGFTMPFEKWFKNELKDYVLTELCEDNLKMIPNIDISKIQFMIKQHLDGVLNFYPVIWKLLVLKQWLFNNGKGYRVI
jgi:asparagine synthase (glutamine-hydrolysing)